MLETYTLTFDYPSSKEHQQLRASDMNMRLTVANSKAEREESFTATAATFQKEIAGMLRSLCVLTQTLAPLPTQRYLTMQMTYYDELTPRDYEPPGFIPQEFDINYLFAAPSTLKHDFGTVKSGHHSIGLAIETDRAIESHAGVPEALVPATQAAPCPLFCSAAKPAPTLETKESRTKPVLHMAEPISHTAKVIPDTQVVRCSCEDNETDLDMIQCDGCGMWQHTPCVGYCSNRDKRIPKDNYHCYHCRFGAAKKTAAYLKDLSCFRRIVAVLYTDGIPSITEVAGRLSTSITKVSRLVKKLEDEGLLVRDGQGSKAKYKPCSGQAVKEKLNHYFGPDVESFKDFPQPGGKRKTEAGFEVKPVPKPLAKRRKSEASLKIDA